MPVSVVIKALKFEGLWKYRREYTEFVCRVVVFNPGRSIDLSTVWPIMFTGVYNTYSMSSNKLWTALTNTTTQMIDIYGKCDKTSHFQDNVHTCVHLAVHVKIVWMHDFFKSGIWWLD